MIALLARLIDAAWWIEEGNAMSIAILLVTSVAIVVSARAVRQARADLALVEDRFGHGDDRRAEDGATLLLARAKTRSELTRLVALILIASLEFITLSLPAVGPSMSDDIIIVLAVRKLGRLVFALLLVWWLWADHLDRRRVLRYIADYRSHR